MSKSNGSAIELDIKPFDFDKAKDSTAASGAPADGKHPLMEMSLDQILALKSWLAYAAADLNSQITRMKLDHRIPRSEYKLAKNAADYVQSFLVMNIATIEQMLDAAKDTEMTPETHN